MSAANGGLESPDGGRLASSITTIPVLGVSEDALEEAAGFTIHHREPSER